MVYRLIYKIATNSQMVYYFLQCLTIRVGIIRICKQYSFTYHICTPTSPCLSLSTSVCAHVGRVHASALESRLMFINSKLLCEYFRTFHAKLLWPSTSGTSFSIRRTIFSLWACELRLGAIKCWYASNAPIVSKHIVPTKVKNMAQEPRRGLRRCALLHLAAAVWWVIFDLRSTWVVWLVGGDLPTHKFTFDLSTLAISPPESLFEMEFWRECV